MQYLKIALWLDRKDEESTSLEPPKSAFDLGAIAWIGGALTVSIVLLVLLFI